MKLTVNRGKSTKKHFNWKFAAMATQTIRSSKTNKRTADAVTDDDNALESSPQSKRSRNEQQTTDPTQTTEIGTTETDSTNSDSENANHQQQVQQDDMPMLWKTRDSLSDPLFDYVKLCSNENSNHGTAGDKLRVECLLCSTILTIQKGNNSNLKAHMRRVNISLLFSFHLL